MEFQERLVALAANEEISDSMIADFLYSVEDALFFQEHDVNRKARSLGINTLLRVYAPKDALRIIDKMLYEVYVDASNKTEKYRKYCVEAGDLWEELEWSSDPSDTNAPITKEEALALQLKVAKEHNSVLAVEVARLNESLNERKRIGREIEKELESLIQEIKLLKQSKDYLESKNYVAPIAIQKAFPIF
jgi:signal transduction histidine kinase